VSKNGLILSSLVTAIPGAVLTYLMVMAFINFAGGPSILHKILCVLALLIGLLLMALPVGIFVLAGPKAEKSPDEKNGDADDVKKSKKKGDEDEVEELVEADSGVSGVTDENLEIESGSLDEFAVTGEVLLEDDEADSGEIVDVEEIEEADEPAPKKGKKK
jgi:hypothetical protein